ncbi:MAG: serine hydrolase [Gemmatimonadota bacterium]
MSVLVRSFAGLALASAALAPLAAQSPFPPDSTIQRILDERVAEKRTFGLVVGTMDAGGKIRIYHAGSSGQDGVALDGSSVFEIGSITKTFTAALLADMVMKGEVKLDDPVAKYLPSTVKIPERGGKQITLYDLATQSSGLPGMPSNFHPADMTNPYADYTVDQMYQFISGYQLQRDIGAKYEYSNLGVGLLGHALARRLGKSWEEAVTERVLKPLGMTDTKVGLTADMRRRLAVGHNEVLKPVPLWDLPTLAGAGALRSTVNDMFKYLAANMDSASKPLGKTLAMTHTSRHEAGGPQMTIGLAWHILHGPDGASLVWHNGGTGGYRTFMGFDPVKHAGVIVLTNSAIGADDIGMHLMDQRLPLTRPPAVRKEVGVDPGILERYTGVYQLAPTLTLTVTLENANLFVEATGQSKVRLYSESETDFFIKEADIQVSFVKDASGAATALILRQGGQDSRAPKVK